MKVPLSWLKELVSTEERSAEEIGHILTMAGLELEGVEHTALPFEGVVVAKILETSPHPDADGLKVAKVFDGKDELQIVCGDLKCKAGMTVALAPIGSRLTMEDGKELKIKKGKLRGVESFGMLCAGDELGLEEASDGILQLNDALQAGTLLASLHTDTILDIALTPNLAHCASIIGIARELAAADNQFFQLPPERQPKESGDSIDALVSVEVKDFERCPRYACRVLRGVKIGPSPAWLKSRLEACGFRSINNVVDATNYILLETGHPLHPFDYQTLAGGSIRIQTAKEGDTFVTLDGIERTLTSDMLMICDSRGPIAVAGVMGGSNSEVTERTTDVLLESAYFHPSNIRRTSKKLQLMTEASRRYERGCDPNAVLYALNRATHLIQELAGGEVAPDIVDIKEHAFPAQTINVRYSRINALLGTNLAVSEIERIFNSLGFSFSWDQQDVFTVTVPTYRVDIGREVDLIEEVARIYGFDNISGQAREQRFSSSVQTDAPIFTFERQVRGRMRAEGLQEMQTCDLISPSLARLGDLVRDESLLVSVCNPTSVEQSVLRPSLLPGLLHVVQYNIAHYRPNVSAYEVGRVHLRVNGQFKEQSALGIVMTGKQGPEHWDIKAREVDFYDLKGLVENLLRGFDVDDVRFEASQRSFFHPGRQAEIRAGGATIGTLGEVHPALCRELDVEQRVYLAEINLHDLISLKLDDKRMHDLAQFPGSDRDWTLTLKEDVPVQAVFDAVTSVRSQLLTEAKVLDVYRSKELGSDRKNITFRFTYRSDKKTLSQEAVEREHGRIEERTRKELGAALLN